MLHGHVFSEFLEPDVRHVLGHFLILPAYPLIFLGGSHVRRRGLAAPAFALVPLGWAAISKETVWLLPGASRSCLSTRQFPKPLADFPLRTVHLSGNGIGYRISRAAKPHWRNRPVPALRSRKSVVNSLCLVLVFSAFLLKKKFLPTRKGFWKLLTHSHPLWIYC